MRPQRKSEAQRYGRSKYEDVLERCLVEMGLPCKRNQVFCFSCYKMWTNNSDKYPYECDHCRAIYNQPRMYCMPDLVVEDPERHGKGVIFVNGIHHDSTKEKKKDQYQINILKEQNWRVFTIWNEELDLMRHANRCFLVLGIYRAMRDLISYNRAYAKEKELLH